MDMFTKTTKTVIAALVLATATVSLASTGYAAPRQHQQGPSDAEKNWMDHASQPEGGNGA
jgi:hypothetical protein